MPYLDEDRKQQLAGKALPTTPGDLTYLFYKTLLDEEGKCHKGSFIDSVEKFLKNRPINFNRYCEIIGAADCAWLEFERRGNNVGVGTAKLNVLSDFIEDFYAERIAPYEDKKIQENGDVV